MFQVPHLGTWHKAVTSFLSFAAVKYQPGHVSSVSIPTPDSVPLPSSWEESEELDKTVGCRLFPPPAVTLQLKLLLCNTVKTFIVSPLKRLIAPINCASPPCLARMEKQCWASRLHSSTLFSTC